MIVAEKHDDRPRVATIMHVGARRGANATEQGIRTDHWVRKATKPPLIFDPQKERDTYEKVRKELLEI
jgi:hypothetical protein